MVAQNSDAKSLNPQVSNDIPTHRVNINIYDRLIEKDKDMKLVPGLAESWEQVDPLTLVFKNKNKELNSTMEILLQLEM